MGSEANAETYIEDQKVIENKKKNPKDHKWSVKCRKGEDTRCEFYCAVAGFCSQFQDTLKEKEEDDVE